MREAGLPEGEVETQKSPQLIHRSFVARRAQGFVTLKMPGSSSPVPTGRQGIGQDGSGCGQSPVECLPPH